MKYIANNISWFDEGSEAYPLTEFYDSNIEQDDGTTTLTKSALFTGIRNGMPDDEVCSLLEFNVLEDCCNGIREVC